MSSGGLKVIPHCSFFLSIAKQTHLPMHFANWPRFHTGFGHFTDDESMHRSGSAILMQRQFPNVHGKILLCWRYYFGSYLDYYEDTSFLQKEGNVKQLYLQWSRALKFPMKDAPIRLEAWYTPPYNELISVTHGAGRKSRSQITEILDIPKTITGTKLKPKQCL